MIPRLVFYCTLLCTGFLPLLRAAEQVEDSTYTGKLVRCFRAGDADAGLLLLRQGGSLDVAEFCTPDEQGRTVLHSAFLDTDDRVVGVIALLFMMAKGTDNLGGNLGRLVLMQDRQRQETVLHAAVRRAMSRESSEFEFPKHIDLLLSVCFAASGPGLVFQLLNVKNAHRPRRAAAHDRCFRYFDKVQSRHRPCVGLVLLVHHSG